MARINQKKEPGSKAFKRQYIYLTEFDKWRLKELANSLGISVSMLAANFIINELDKTPSLDLKIERGK